MVRKALLPRYFIGIVSFSFALVLNSSDTKCLAVSFYNGHFSPRLWLILPSHRKACEVRTGPLVRGKGHTLFREWQMFKKEIILIIQDIQAVCGGVFYHKGFRRNKWTRKGSCERGIGWVSVGAWFTTQPGASLLHPQQPPCVWVPTSECECVCESSRTSAASVRNCRDHGYKLCSVHETHLDLGALE